MNSYFASVEQQANPFLRGKPIGVTGKRQERSVLATASREAKALGVKTAMSTWEAKKILPSLILIAGDPEKYGEITARFNAIFHEFTDKVEAFSVDESFLDVTDEAQDYLGATVMAQMIRVRLREECGELITASIGVGPNKLIAKLSSERMKPNGLTVTRPDQVIELLDQVELQDICGIGPRIAARLEAMGVHTIPELRAQPIERLVREFKSYGVWLYEAARGRGDDEVISGETDPKSVGHSYTFPKDLKTADEIRRGLLMLCDKVAWRLRRDGFAARCISAYVRYGDFSGDGKQHRIAEPINDGLKIFETAWSLLTPLVTHRLNDLATQRLSKPVRLLGVSASLLTRGPEQPSLFPKQQKMARTLQALDKIQRRYGSNAWTRASLVNVSLLERTSGFHYDHEI